MHKTEVKLVISLTCTHGLIKTVMPRQKDQHIEYNFIVEKSRVSIQTSQSFNIGSNTRKTSDSYHIRSEKNTKSKLQI